MSGAQKQNKLKLAGPHLRRAAIFHPASPMSRRPAGWPHRWPRTLVGRRSELERREKQVDANLAARVCRLAASAALAWNALLFAGYFCQPCAAAKKFPIRFNLSRPHQGPSWPSGRSRERANKLSNGGGWRPSGKRARKEILKRAPGRPPVYQSSARAAQGHCERPKRALECRLKRLAAGLLRPRAWLKRREKASRRALLGGAYSSADLEIRFAASESD